MNKIIKNNTQSAESFMVVMQKVWGVLLPRIMRDNDSIVTPLQLSALAYLSRHPGSKVSALAGSLHLSSSATAQLTDRLAKLGYLKRETHSEDRRAVLLSTTTKGEATFGKLHKVRLRTMEKMLGYLPKKDVDELVRIFSGLLLAVEKSEQ